MTDHRRARAAMLMECLELVPPLVREGLLSDSQLRRDFGLKLDAEIRFGDSNVTFRRSTLYAAVRAAGAARGIACKIADLEGAEWEVIAGTDKTHPDLVIQSGPRIMHAAHLLLLTKHRNTRTAFFSREAKRLNLPREVKTRWAQVLAKRPLLDDEIDELLRDALHTPIAVNGQIMEQLRKPRIPLEVLVPRSLDYYEQLIGRIDGQPGIRQYVKEVAVAHVRRLVAWHPVAGLQQALLMASHSLITDVISKTDISDSEFANLALWAQGTDALTRGAVLELAIKRAGANAKIRSNVVKLAEHFCRQSDGGKEDQFTIFSAIFLMVDGELSKTRIMASKPPFWRRLASLAQAALINRCISAIGGDLTGFIAWARSVHSAQFQMQCYVDLRLEPRWLAEFAMPRQLKHEIGGRVLSAAHRHAKATDTLGLKALLTGNARRSLKKQLTVPLTGLPGPLEGNVEPAEALAPEILDEMRAAFAVPAPDISGFARVANVALFCKLPDDILQLAADAIRRMQHRLPSDGAPEMFRSSMVGLATLAAVSRSQSLADELLIVIRRYRRFFREEMDLDTAFQAGMLACASRVGLDDWCKCVGGLIADLGFGELTREEGSALHELATTLCDGVPELWAACGRGIAALEAAKS